MVTKNPVLSDESEKEDEKKEGTAHEIAEIREKYSQAAEYWSDDREQAKDDIEFRAGKQWPEDIKHQRDTDKRPSLVLDKLNQYVRQIVNDGRQNRPSIKVRPVDSGADIATAEVFQGIIRHIEDRSGADAAYDTALDSAATCGFGYFTVTTEYASDTTFDQEICIERVRNPLSVVIDPDAQKADASDMKYCFVIEEMSKEDFKEKYPGKYPQDFQSDSDYGDWFGDHVRIARYWHIEEEDRQLHLLKDGKVVSDEGIAELKAMGVDLEGEIVESRNIPKRTVKHCLVTGADYLEEPKVWPGKYIPVLVVWGNEIDVEGKVMHSGIIRPGKDPQRLYNYSRSAFAERVALTPKAPWVAAEGQVEDYSDEWETANTENHSVLRYRPVSLNGQPVPPPIRQTAADVPVGFAQDMQISEHDIQAAIGMYAASLGAPSNERSGKAIMARQREGDVGTFHYHDNLNRAIRHCGRILVDLIPHIYDSTRVVRILGYDGSTSEASLDPTIESASESNGINTIYNLGVGTYDVTISTGPSYSTLRQESAQAMIEMTQANPQLMGIIGDLMIKNMDWPGAEEISERLKLTLPPEIQQAEQAKKSKRMPPEMQQIISQFEQAMQQKDEMMGQASAMIEQLQGELTKLKNEDESKEKEVIIKAVDSEIRAYDAETKRLQVVQTAMSPEQIQAIVMQTLQDLLMSNAQQYPQVEEQEVPEMAEMPMANMPPQGMEIPMEQLPQ